MSKLFSAVCSITPTQRRRYFWAVWWTDAPHYAPFRKPDASAGGASSLEEALAAAERAAQRHLVLIEPYWARAWKQMLRGHSPPPPPPPSARAGGAKKAVPRSASEPTSAWSILGLERGAPLSEVKRAFRKRALETHPDQGGDPALFRAAQGAYEKLCASLEKKAKK